MDIEKAVQSLATPLPEDILKRKWAGDLTGAVAAIDLRLQEALPETLAWRLRVERERLRRMPTQYPWNRAQAFEKLRELAYSDLPQALGLGLEMTMEHLKRQGNALSPESKEALAYLKRRNAPV